MAEQEPVAESGIEGPEDEVNQQVIAVRLADPVLLQPRLQHHLGQLFPVGRGHDFEGVFEEAERGARLVAVPATDVEPREWDKGILKAHGGHAIRHDGDRSFTNP